MNTEVNVNAFYFARRRNGLSSFPKQIELGGRQIIFAENGLRYLVGSGRRAVRLFDMSDGHHTYRLRQAAGQWTLVGTRGGTL